MYKEYHLTPKMLDGNCQVVSADSCMVLQYVTTSLTCCQLLSGCNLQTLSHHYVFDIDLSNVSF